jgi:hypothetical protein
LKKTPTQIDTNTKLGKELVKMNWDKDIRPKLRWLAGDVGVDLEIIGSYLTRNPYFLIQDLDNLKVTHCFSWFIIIDVSVLQYRTAEKNFQ